MPGPGDNGGNKEDPKPVVPQPIGQIKITIMDDGGVSVIGFPPSLDITREWIAAGDRVVVRHFIKLASDGKLDENGNVIEKKILTADKTLVDAHGNPIIQ